jgi:hypothetical protein
MESLPSIPCHTCREKIKIFKVFGNIKGDCVVCFNNDVEINMFMCGHYVCKDCMDEMQLRAPVYDEEIQLGDTQDEDVYINNVLSESEIQEDLQNFYALTVELEYRIAHLGDIAGQLQLLPIEITKLKDWIDANQAIHCNELLECFNEVIEAMQLTFPPTIEYFREELENVINDM